MPQILIVEDDPAIATTLKFSFEREGWQVTWIDNATNVATTLNTLDTLDAIILDIGLPDGDGFGVCQGIRTGEQHAHVPIVFLTARDDKIDTIVALEMGGDDYITKPFSPREVIARIKAIWRREKLAETPKTTEPNQDFIRQTTVGIWQYRHSDYCLSLDGRMLSLSKTELAIMLSLLANPTHVLSREQILAKASDHPEHRLARTIDSHIKTLRQKLSLISSHDIIITHRGLGYSLC